MTGPSKPKLPYPMHICAADGIVYDERRTQWYGLPEIGETLHCPACGSRMEGTPRDPPVRIFYCFQCGTTFDRVRQTWYGLVYHHASS